MAQDMARAIGYLHSRKPIVVRLLAHFLLCIINIFFLCVIIIGYLHSQGPVVVRVLAHFLPLHHHGSRFGPAAPLPLLAASPVFKASC